LVLKINNQVIFLKFLNVAGLSKTIVQLIRKQIIPLPL